MNADSPDSGRLPLEGVVVVDLTRALSGPFCTMVLGDLGATVYKVESEPHGDMTRTWGPFHDSESIYYLSCNRNKRSVAIDLRSERGRSAVMDMLSHADVFVQNFKPGVAEEIGFGPDVLRKRHPRLICADISGFGRGGPYQDWPGLDQVAQGMSGLMSLTGDPGGAPTRVGVSIADMTAGLWLCIGILAALAARPHTGSGAHVSTALLSSLVSMLGVNGQRYLSSGEAPSRTGNDHPVIAPYGVFQAADGPLSIACATQVMWSHLCKELNEPDLAQDPRFIDNASRVSAREPLREVLNQLLGRRSREYWLARLLPAGIPAGPILTVAEVFNDPHVIASGGIQSLPHPRTGTLRVAANPIVFDGVRVGGDGLPPPRLGAHTAEFLAELERRRAMPVSKS
ncbi:CaiB/BaiF CoA transferase family protein [Hydrogenophaga sp. BPS33]|uniref:CaiB/BaiF CoA transferase family protein n=1 Tax=Hydrogenophaga sp. BPS33 TaxID=2651974 RepID=UPI00131F89D3|nr:CoA transferase [Hydrogenophaga sp. BPS33]QHE84704.1 CoA transferase [Hydrogenophaga sp. BPS33]